ncbi:hypothetical protein ACQP2F_11435 [Actinoplanes sp. CA-030573]|uniref:hypothetical protein n=1 Tax=Actinoplanes sp. CA-030573 TaxID=3239898 RepID=UPI003D91C051
MNLAKRFLHSGSVFLIGADPPRPGGRREHVATALATAAALYVGWGATTYLERKSGLPVLVCAAGGAALGVPMVLAVTRPLLAWRALWLASAVTGILVQSHHRTPFSWHPAVLAAQMALLFVIALRVPFAVSAWAWASMAALIGLSFYPADRVPLIEIVTVLTGVAWLIRGVRTGRRSQREVGTSA